MKVTSVVQDTITLGEIWELGIPESEESDEEGITRTLGTPLPVVSQLKGVTDATHVYKTQGRMCKYTFEDEKGQYVLELLGNHKLALWPESGDWIRVADMVEFETIVQVYSDGKETTPALFIKVEDVGVEEAYDIFVPNGNAYIANGLVSHNSVMAQQIAMNQALLGYKVLFVPLEMSLSEMISRGVANKASLENTSVLQGKLAQGEKEKGYKSFMRFDKQIAAANGRLTIFKPKEDLTIEEIMASVHGFGADSIFIDYITLLRGADGEDQWRKLGQIARYGKIYADAHNKSMCLLAQVGDDGKLRYSQAVKEHSSLAWSFSATKESREKGYLRIEPFKARNQSMDPFVLKVDYPHQRVTDLTPEELATISSKAKTTSTPEGPRGKGKDDSSKYMIDLSSDE